MIKMLCTGILLLSGLFGATQAMATDPVELIRQTSEKVLTTLEENKTLYEKEPEKIQELVNDIVLPHMDFRAMSMLALGKNWRSATQAQQEKFVDAFRAMLVRTYSKSLTAYTGQKIEFLPYTPPEAGKRTTTVQTQVALDDGAPIPIDYKLRIKDDIWKVYDITIDGISLVTNYRNSFASDIRKVGMDGLIEKLMNQQEKVSS